MQTPHMRREIYSRCFYFFYLQSEQTGHVYLARQIVSINYNDKYLPHTFAR